MNSEQSQVVEKINQLSEKPGGKQAVRFLLYSMGSIPFVGGAIAGSASIWSEKEQGKLNEAIVEWINNADITIAKIDSALEKLFEGPTKAKLSILIGEIAGVDMQVGCANNQFHLMLNSDSVNELMPYTKLGWITLSPTNCMMNLGAGNSIGNSIEDKKRNWGMGNGFLLQVKQSFFE